MTVIRRALSESITHVEDLPIDQFIDALRNLPTMVAQEKLDGANLWLGVDEQGQFFTSREGKRKDADRRYKAEDWPLVSAYNQFRAAHAALEQKAEEIKRVLRPGDTVEAEVLFGRQPNSVTYGAGGKSYIAFLRGVNGSPDTLAEQLGQTLANQQVDAKVTVVDTEDGETLNDVEQTFPFQFTTPQTVDSSHLKQASHVDSLLQKLEGFLHKQSGMHGMTNMELLTVNLQQVDKEKRQFVKQARADLLAKVQTEYKLPIKQALLDKVVRKIRSGLTDTEASGDEDIGIEGIVLRDPKTGNQIKIVDKDVFTTINKFNQSARQSVQSALNTVDPDAPIEARGGLVGQLRIRIAELLGNRDLAKQSNVRKALEPIKGASPEDTIKNFAASMAGVDDFEMTKKKILAMTMETAQELKAKLEEFKEHQSDYRLKLKNGKEMGLSKDTVKRTLLTFAEAKRNLTNLFDKIKSTQSLAQLLAVLYGSQAKAVHQIEELEESLLEAVKHTGDVDRSEYEHRDAFQLWNAYLATVFMSMLIYHENDPQGMRILRDRSNMGLKKWSKEMSPLNHWGYVIWRNAKPDVKKQLTKKTQQELFHVTRHITPAWWRFLHMDFSYNKDVKVDWSDHRRTLERVINLSGLRSERLNSMLEWMVLWPELKYDDKVKAMHRLYMYAMQFVPRSDLFVRLRVMQQNLLLNATGTNDQMVTEGLLKSIAEEADAPAGDAYSQPVAATVNATTAAAVASQPTRVGARTIVKRKRNPEVVKRLTMKFPDPRNDE